MVCSIEGCGRKHYGHGLCKSHCRKKRLYGDPLGGGARWGEPLAFLRSLPDTDDCILWPYGKTSRGYGTLLYEGRRVTAHRLSLLLHAGSPTDGDDHALHGPCHQPACVNPRHLSWGAPAQNAMDRIRDGSQKRGEGVHWSAKLTDADVIEARALRHLDGLTVKELAERYGLNSGQMSRVLNGKGWTHLNPVSPTAPVR